MTATPTTPSTDPIRSLLPAVHYQQNEVVEWVLEPWERQAVEALEYIKQFYANHMDPATAQAESLDWLAQFAGYTGPFWDTTWPSPVKRILIAEAFTRVWPKRGTVDLFVWLLDLFGLEANVLSSEPEFLADLSVAGDVVGGGGKNLIIAMPMDYSWYEEFIEVEKLCGLFLPCWSEYTVCYERSLADVFRAGDVLL